MPYFRLNPAGGFSKTASATRTVTVTPGVDWTTGTLVVLAITFDNLTTTTPTIVSAVHDYTGDANGTAFTQQAIINSPQAASGGGLRMALLTHTVGSTWPVGPTRTFTVTLSASITASVIQLTAIAEAEFDRIRYSNAVAQGAANYIASQQPDFDGAWGVQVFGVENNISDAYPAITPDPTTWVFPTAQTQHNTTGGSAVTNIGQRMVAGRMPWVNTNWGVNTTSGGDNATIWAELNPVLPPTLTQAAFRFYADGTESGSTALDAQDTAPSVIVGGTDAPLGLRVRVQETGGGVVYPTLGDFQLQYERNNSGTWLPVTSEYPGRYEGAVAQSNATIGTTGDGYFQTFMGNGQALLSADFRVLRAATVSGNFQAVLYAHRGAFGAGGFGTGSVLATSTPRAKSSFQTSYQWETFTFDGSFTLAAGTAYVIGVVADPGSTGTGSLGTDSSGTDPGVMNYFTGSSFNPSNNNDVQFRVLTTTPSFVRAYASADLTDGGATTSRLTGGTGSFVAGKVSEDGLADDVGMSATNHTELLYAINLIAADLSVADTLRFRVLREGAVLDSYAQVPTLTVGSSGPQTYQVSGTVPVLTAVTGDATRVPIIQQVSGTVAVNTTASGNATIFVPPVTHQVSGTVAVATSAAGTVSLRQPVSGTVPVVVGTAGTVSARLRVAGTVPVVVGTAGTVRAILSAAGTVPVATTVTGDATRVPLTFSVSGTVAVVTTAAGDATVQSGTVTHQVSGTVPVVTNAVGDATRVPLVLSVSGTVPVVTTVTGDATRVPITHQVSGTVAVVTTVAGTVTARLPVSGTVPVFVGTSGTVSAILSAAGVVPVVTTVTGNATRVPLTFQVSGTVAVTTNAAGTVSSRLPVSGTVQVITTVPSGAPSARFQVSGVVPVVTTTSGTALPTGGASGTVNVVVSVTGTVSQKHMVSGSVAVTTSAAGAITSRQQVAGSAAVVTTASGTVSNRSQVSGVVPVVVGVTGDATRVPIVHQVSGTVAVTTTASGFASLVGAPVTYPVSGTVAVTTVAVGTISKRSSVSGVVPVVTTTTGAATRVAIVHQVAGRVDIVIGVTSTVRAIYQISGVVPVITGVSGTLKSLEFPPLPCNIDLIPSGPRLSLAGTAEDYSVTKRAERLTLEGVC